LQVKIPDKKTCKGRYFSGDGKTEFLVVNSLIINGVSENLEWAPLKIKRFGAAEVLKTAVY